MNKSRLAWAITGSGHYIEECLDFLLTLDDADLFLSQTMEEAIKMYGFNVNDISEEMPVYRDEAASSSRVGNFYNGNFHAFAMASMTSNMAAKRVLGIAGSLMANLYHRPGNAGCSVLFTLVTFRWKWKSLRRE